MQNPVFDARTMVVKLKLKQCQWWGYRKGKMKSRLNGQKFRVLKTEDINRPCIKIFEDQGSKKTEDSTTERSASKETLGGEVVVAFSY